MNNRNTQNIVKTALLLAIAIVFQFVGRNVPQINQFLVGPVVNAVLLMTTYICGTKWGVLSALLTPVMALIVGQLATPMAPFVPFIMTGNILYVVIFGVLKDRNYGAYFGVVLGAVLKFLFLFLSASKLVRLLGLGIPAKVADKLIVSMGIPQLITGLAGGIIAIVLVEILVRRRIIET